MLTQSDLSAALDRRPTSDAVREDAAERTPRGAFLRVLDARTGSLAPGSPPAYLEALRRHVADWLDCIDHAIATD